MPNWYNRWGKAIAGVVPYKRPKKRGENVLPDTDVRSNG